jgi:hypothetical protein
MGDIEQISKTDNSSDIERVDKTTSSSDIERVDKITSPPDNEKVNNISNASEYYTSAESGKTDSEITQENKPSVEDEKILAELLEQHKIIEDSYEKEMAAELEKRLEEANINFNIFSKWMSLNLKGTGLYKSFIAKFDTEYRMAFFSNVSDFFSDNKLVTDTLLFYFKVLIFDMLKTHKKFKSCVTEITIDHDTQKTNLRLIKAKQTFKIFINDELLCYFKENGNDYYLS